MSDLHLTISRCIFNEFCTCCAEVGTSPVSKPSEVPGTGPKLPPWPQLDAFLKEAKKDTAVAEQVPLANIAPCQQGREKVHQASFLWCGGCHVVQRQTRNMLEDR